MKPASFKATPLIPFIQIFGIALMAAMIAGCGGYKAPSTTTTATSGIKKRVLLSNEQSGSVSIVDATADTSVGGGFTVFGASRVTANGGVAAVISNNGCIV